MLKLFGLRITPFFLFILGLECLSLLLSVYLGILLHGSVSGFLPYPSIHDLAYLGLLLL